MKYSDFIEVNHDFQFSVNLEYDLNKVEKIKGYLPTVASVDVLGTYLKSFYYDRSHRSTVLVGPYGRGKSHLLLVLTALTSYDSLQFDGRKKKKARKVQLELCDKIMTVQPEIGALARMIVENNIRTLPIIVNSNTTDINQAFLVAMHDALERAGLLDLLPDMYFDAAVETISRWEKEYQGAYQKLEQLLDEKKLTVNKMYIGLKQYDQQWYDLFCSFYPKIAAGSVFNPMSNTDVVKLYSSVVEALNEKSDFCGINIIFDEFSKFLEANLDASRMLNFKIIQDLAEIAERSGKKQIHFTCITHKNILDYSASDSFKAVEGRFTTVRFNATAEQSYELIANTIIKKKDFNYLVTKKHSLELKDVMRQTNSLNIFDGLDPKYVEKNILKGCFPLAPASAYALIQISELVGQNERTLFTFLTQDEPHSMSEFVKEEHDEFTLIGFDRIYDYFQDLFRQEVFNSRVHDIWTQIDASLSRTGDENAKKILKAIGIILLIADENIKTTPAHIKAVLLMKDEVFETAVRSLLKDRILLQRDSLEFVLMTARGADVQNDVDEYVNTKIPRIDICELLEEANPLGHAIPRKFNDQFSMFRYFKKIYLLAEVFVQYTSGSEIFNDYPYDGLIIYIISSAEEMRLKVLEKITQLGDFPQIIICVSEENFKDELLLKKYFAVQRLLQKSEEIVDPRYQEELELFAYDISSQIKIIIENNFGTASEKSHYLNCSGELYIRRNADLGPVVSEICSRCYPLTPILNNEMVNKKSLNAQNIKGRNIAIDWIFEHSEDSIIRCMDGYGPEVSIFKSAYARTGLDGATEIRDPGMRAVLEKIENFIKSCEQERQDFSELYKCLQAPPFGIRKGILPLLIAYVLRKYKEYAVFYFNSKEIELSSAILSNINDMPENYELLIEQGTAEREAYMNQLEDLFSSYEDYKIRSINRVYVIVKNMQNWARALPEYTKKFKIYYDHGEKCSLNRKYRSVRDELLKFEVNSRQLVYEDLPGILGGGDLQKTIQEISYLKNILDDHVNSCREELKKVSINIIWPDYQGTLSAALTEWYKESVDHIKNHMFDSTTNALISIVERTNSYDDEQLLDKLIQLFTALTIQDWNDKSVDVYQEALKASIEQINECQMPVEDYKTDGILAVTIGDQRIEKHFSSDSITGMGQTALNNIREIFEDYNEALEPDEKLAIISELLRDMLH